MKTTRFFKGLAAMAMAATLMTSCYDDLELRQEIEGLGNEVEQIKTDLAQLKSDLAALKAAADKDLTVVELNKLADGYEIVFSDGTKAVIKNGKDGKDGLNGTNGKDGVDGTDGKNAVAPVVGVAEDEDGNLYWTVDGEWLLIDGEKVRANAVDGVDGAAGAAGKPGADAKAPVVTIALDEDGYYYWQVDGEWLLVDGEKVRANGIDGAAGEPGHNPVITVEWSQSNDCYVWRVDGVTLYDQNGAVIPARGPVGPQGDAFFRSVEFSNDGPKLVISIINPEYPDDPTKDLVYEIPVGVFYISFDEMEATGVTTEAKRFNYTISGVSANDEVIVRVLSTNATDYRVVPETNAKGYVEVNLPSGEGYVDVYALNNTTGDFKAKSIKVEGTDFVLEETVSALHFSPAGDSVELPLTTGVEYEVVMSVSGWLTAATAPRTRAVSYETLTLSAPANTGADAADRNTTVTIRNKANTEKVYATFTINQKNYNPALISDGVGEDAEPIIWEESFGVFAEGKDPADMTQAAATYKNTFTIALSDDFSKGAYKISNMFVYNNAYTGKTGGTYYADIEGNVLTVYKGTDATYSYNFNDAEVKLTYDSTNKTFASAPIKFGYHYNNADLRDGGVIGGYSVKVYEPAVEPETPETSFTLNGVWDQNVSGMSYPSPSATMTISVSGSTVTITDFICAGTVAVGTLSGNEITIPGGTSIGTGSSTAGPLDADVILTISDDYNTITSSPFSIAGWVDVSSYSAEKQVKNEAPKPTVNGVWNQAVSGMSYPSPSATMTISVSGSTVTITDFICAGTVAVGTLSGNEITIPGGTSIGTGSSTAGPLDADVILTISDDYNTITSSPFSIAGWVNVSSYSATRQ